MPDKKFFYERFADVFDEKMNKYDLSKRLRIIFEDLLPENLQGKRLLDAGCGTGWFSSEAAKRQALVVSLDVGTELLKKAGKKCNSVKLAGDVLTMPFKDDLFDIIISTEVIEHTVNPKGAIFEMRRVLKPEGLLILTTPNRVWYFSIWLANLLRLRPYEGYENWISWRQLKSWILECGFVIESMRGFNIFPFVFSFSYPFLDYCDRFGLNIGPCMLNIAVRARKKRGVPGDA